LSLRFSSLLPFIFLAPGGGFEPKPSVVSKTTVLPLDDPGPHCISDLNTHLLIHANNSIGMATNWLARKVSNLDFPRSERGVFPATLLANELWLRRRDSNPHNPD
jgi:hypothetical protein